MDSTSSILIASNSAADAELVRNLLLKTCSRMILSVHAEHHLSDFEAHLPDVLVLAFNDLEEARSYYQGLCRSSQVIASHRHRTVLLCRKEDLKAAYDLCRQEEFDDYVLFWPMSFDATRLSISVLLAVRAVHALRQSQAKPQVGKSVKPAIKSYSAPEPKIDPSLAHIKIKLEPPARSTIMLIDDEIFQHNLVRYLLSGLNCDFIFAFSGTEAISKLQYVRPSLILMDVQMPGMSGVDLTRHLKSIPGGWEIPIVMVTGNSDKDVVEKSLQAGAVDFLVKPFSQDMFLKKLQRFLR
jgi:CheY-like chemotaxis protein